MGVETAVALGGASALGGAIKGAKGTPDQKITSQTSIAPASAQEQALQSQSLSNYNQANNLASQAEQGINGAQSYQDQARLAGMGVLSGQSFNVTPEEQQRIQGLRDALVQQGTQDINYQTQQGLGQVAQSAGARNLRGQALTSLQGNVLQNGQRLAADVANQANSTAAQAYLTMPQQRIQAQQGYIQQGLSLGDSLRQQAIQNRNTLQDPALMQYLQNERRSNQTQTQVTPGQRGGIGGAIGGALGGAGAGFNLGTGLAGAYNNLSGASALRPGGYMNSGGDYTGSGDTMDYRNFYLNNVK